MQITLCPEIEELLIDLCRHIERELGKNLIAVYVYGSLVTGDFDRNISDLDLLVVVAADICMAEFERLDRMHADFVADHSFWTDRVEIAYLSARALQTFRVQASPIAVISPGEPFHIKQAGKDWLINWWVVRSQGVALVGLPPEAVIPQIADAEFLRAVQEQVAEWQSYIHHMRLRKQQAYAILTMCRALYAYTNHEQVSKLQAARWAQDHFPEWATLIGDAVDWRAAWYPDEKDDETLFPETLSFIQFTGNRIVSPQLGNER